MQTPETRPYNRDAGTYSVILPVYNNDDTLEELAHRLMAVLATMTNDYQLVFVNDASPDTSPIVLQQLAHSFPQQVTVLHHDENRGQREAIRTGLRASHGDILVVMDADLQDIPEAILNLHATLHSRQVDAVFAAHVGTYQAKARMASSRAFKSLLRHITGLPEGAGSFVLFTRRLANHILAANTQQFYLAGLIACSGYPFTAVEIPRNSRLKGQSAYNTAMRMSVALAYLHCLVEVKLPWRKKTI